MTNFTFFKESIDDFSLPERFNFPFYYTPHPLCLLAAKELQKQIEGQKDRQGKMFGVLVVRNEVGQIGYLAGFQGELAKTNNYPKFVPPVFDIAELDDFFSKEEAIVNAIKRKLELVQQKPEYLQLVEYLKAETILAESQIWSQKQELRKGKQARKIRRNNTEYHTEDFLEELSVDSLKEHYELKDLKKYWKHRLTQTQEKIEVFETEIAVLKEELGTRFAAVQQHVFEKYDFLNMHGNRKNLFEIFQQKTGKNSPLGAGDCAAPKLLQYAFLHGMKPLSMAEFWWGQSPDSEIRKHGNFYPACRGKCEPILAHMLDGIEMDENPILSNLSLEKTLETVYEDEYLLVLNKPSEFLSVPGINIQDSVYARMKQKYPEAKGPLVVHRLDMSTSGLMLIAKTIEAHKNLQQQFMNRSVKKQYVAILNGIIEEDEGTIDLTLRVDLDNRPQQLVCYEHGKSAITNWKVISRTKETTRIHFFPITGRTHQLRVHAAHFLGLNVAILGDDLYGTKEDRLYLHAESIEFSHPITKEKMCVSSTADF